MDMLEERFRQATEQEDGLTPEQRAQRLALLRRWLPRLALAQAGYILLRTAWHSLPLLLGGAPGGRSGASAAACCPCRCSGASTARGTVPTLPPPSYLRPEPPATQATPWVAAAGVACWLLGRAALEGGARGGGRAASAAAGEAWLLAHFVAGYLLMAQVGAQGLGPLS